MNNFRKTVYLKLARDFILARPKFSQVRNFVKYRYYSRSHSLPEEIYSFTPLSSIICVTRRCNLRCPFCHSLDELNRNTVWEYELDGDKLRKILHHPLVKDSLRINFTGGEPFLNKHIFELIKIVRAHKHLLMISTNGMFIDNMVEDILKAKINVLSFSLYEENRAKLCHNIPLVAGKVFTKLHKVIFSDTLKDIYETVSLAIELKVDGILFQNYYTKEKDTHRCVSDDNDEYAAIKKEIGTKYKDKIDIVWFPPLPRNISAVPRNCKMLWHNLKIDAKGNIGPCCFTFPNKERYGNMFDDENVWNSKFFISMRRMMNNLELPLSPICRNCYLLTEDLYGI